MWRSDWPAILARPLLFGTALVVSLLIAEALVRVFQPQVPPDAYEQRFLVDGRPSFTPGFLANDPVLPFALEPNYRHTIVNFDWYPKAWVLVIDEHGYRNSVQDGQPASVVFVGDSVVFGAGVDEEDSLPVQLEKRLGERTYNLGIPGLGPESYMVMLERYLEANPAPRLVIVSFFTGNDYWNLSGAYWSELAHCLPPRSKIFISNSTPFIMTYPIWITTSPLKSSHLVSWLVKFTIGPTQVDPGDLAVLARTHRVLSERAIVALKYVNPSSQDLEAAKEKALYYAAALERADCLTRSEREMLQAYEANMQQGDWRTAYPIALRLVADLVDRDCNPIDKEQLINVTPSFAHYAGFHWKRLDEPAFGDIMAYDLLLGSLCDHPGLAEFSPTFRSIRTKLSSRDLTVESDIRGLSDELARRFERPAFETPAGCDQLDLSLRRTRDLAANSGSEIRIVGIPAEYQLRSYVVDGQSNDICERANQHGIDCFDLTPLIVEYYLRSDDALYLDSSHLNPQGSALVADWIYRWLKEMEKGRE